MSTTPNQKDLLAKKTDLEGILKPDANNILHLPDITITLAESGQFYLAGISKKLLTLIGNTSGNAVTLDGDAGLTFTTSGGSSTITGITSSSGNSTSLAASQSMVSAKQDALTAGTNITISNNTISATDTNTLSDLTDTAISSLADGQVLKYNATSGKWVNGTGGSGGAEVILGTTAPTAAQGSNGNLYIQYDDTNNNTVTHEYVKISGAWEEIAIGGGGSSVIANPSGTATATLNKVEIDNVIYDLPSGGGSGGGSYLSTVINDGTAVSNVLSLSNPYTDFDELLFTWAYDNNLYITTLKLYTSNININDTITLDDYYSRDMVLTVTSTTAFTITSQNDPSMYVLSIRGLKYSTVSKEKQRDVLWTTGTWTMAHPITDYDEIVFRWGNGNATSFIPSDIMTYQSFIVMNPTNSTFMWFDVTDASNFTVHQDNALTITSVEGVIYTREEPTVFAEEMTLADYSALTTEEKNDGTIRFIPESNMGYGLDIDFTNSTIYGESGMSGTTVNNNSVQIVWNTSDSNCGLTIYPTIKVDVTNYDFISYDFTSTNSYDSLHPGSENPVRDLGIGLCSSAPSAFTYAPSINWAIWNRYKVTDVGTTFTDERIDVSNLTGEYYLIIACVGWNAVVSNIVIGTEGGNPSQIKYMDKTYGISSGSGEGGTTTEEIYKNTAGTIPDTINLTKPINDFDIILITGFRSNTPTWKISSFYVSSAINQGDVIELNDDAYYAWYTVTDLSTLTKNAVQYDVIDTIYGLKFGGGGGGDASAEEMTLAEYSELTEQQKNDGTIRFIPAGSGSEGLTAIDMTDITVYKEGSMNATAVSSSEIDVTWNSGVQIGCNFDFNTPIDVTDYDRITFKVTNGSCYNSGTQAMYPRWDMMIGLMSAPLGELTNIEPTDSRWIVVADMPLSNHVYEETLDVSELTGNYYIVVSAHGWNTTIEDITLRQGGDYPSQIRYMSKTYADSSGAPAMNLTQAEYDALTQEEKENGTIYFVGGDTSTQLIERVSAADNHITSSGHSGWGGEDWGAFDGTPAAVSGITNAWCALEDDATPWIQYHFDQPYYLTKLVMVVYQHYNASSSAKTVNMNILGSNDGSTWTNIAADGQTKSVTFNYQVKSTVEIELNLGQYEYIRIQGTEAFEVAYNFGCDFDEIYVYGGANPITLAQKIYYMGKCYTNTEGSASLTPGDYININNDIISVTANDSQTYEGDLVSRVSAADTHITASTSNSSYPAWGAFNGTSPSNLASPDANSCWLPEVNLTNQWIQYHFDSAKYFTSLTIDAFSNYSDAWVGTIKVEGSNDGTIFTNILENGSTQSITAPLQSISTITVDLNDSDTWTYIRITFVEAMSIAYYPSLFIDEIHFYGGSAGGNNIVSLSDFSKLSAQQISDLQSAIGGGGGNPELEETALLTTPITAEGTYTLLDNIEDYDFVSFVSGVSFEADIRLLAVSDMLNMLDDNLIINCAGTGGRWFNITALSGTSITITKYSETIIHSIMGYKYKGGGSKSDIVIVSRTDSTNPYAWLIPCDANGNALKPSEVTLLSIFAEADMSGAPPYYNGLNVCVDTDTDRYLCKLYNTQNGVYVGDGTYSVDYTVAYIPNSGGSSGGGINYSTTEQAIGTWIDGKTLYQKTYHYPGTLSGNANLDPTFTSSNIDYFTYCDMSYMVNNSYRGSGFQIEMGFNSNGLFIDANNAPNASYSDIYVTIRYTKVTQGQN